MCCSFCGVVCCLMLFFDCCWLFVVCYLSVVCGLFFGCCLVVVVCCLLYVVLCLWFAVSCVLFFCVAGCYSLLLIVCRSLVVFRRVFFVV